MISLSLISDLRQQLQIWRSTGATIALVPTMGNLHAGHFELISKAKQHADFVVVSIFVNPTQFGPNEDFASYPRTQAIDQEKLTNIDTDLLFLPAEREMYHQQAITRIELKGLTDLHCGKSRPGHFSGVATIVCKLFNMVQPDFAVFGRKDYQQLVVITKMVNDLNLPIKLIGIDTIRESDGLAMSSRNGYLTSQQRTIAPMLYQCLNAAKTAILEKNNDFSSIIHDQTLTLEKAGFLPEYFTICNSDDLLPTQTYHNNLVILAAARLGQTRLIDNIEIPYLRRGS